MKTKKQDEQKRGGALIVVMLMAALASGIMSSYLAYSSHSARSTTRMIDYQKAKIAAEAALEYGVMQLRDFIVNNQFTLTQTQVDYILGQMQPPPSMAGYEFQTPVGDVAFDVKAQTPVIQGVITNGAACIGSEGEYQLFTITAGAVNPGTGVGAVLQQDLQGVGLFLIRYAVFYEHDLEINPGPSMTISGPVHANADIYLAPNNGPLHCTDRLTTVGGIYRRRKDSNNSIGVVHVDNADGLAVSMTFDSTDPNWMLKAIEKWDGRVLTGAHGVQHLSPPIAPVDVPYDIITRALDPMDPHYQLQTEAEKFYNKAGLIIHVSSSGVFTATGHAQTEPEDLSSYFTNAVLVPSGGDYAKGANFAYSFETNGAFDITKVFRDKREDKDMLPVDIYIDALMEVYPHLFDTNYTVPEGRGVIYITRDDPDGVGVGMIPCVRIRNAWKLPQGGMTIASDLPVYVEGHYNISDKQPSLVTGDAVTFLSRNWQDARSWNAHVNQRPAESTEYNVVIMTGNTETQWGAYNGGLENVLRFLERWSGKTVKFRGAIIDLWYSRLAISPWKYGNPIYEAPHRDWGYDTMYKSKVPPAMTRVFGLEATIWRESSWAEVGWN